MGDFTPEALEIQCPGCKSRFRIKPKSENLDNTTVSCPKCFADIPVESNRLPAGSSPSPDLSQVDVAFSRVETRRTAAFPPDKTPSHTIRSLTAQKLGSDEQDAVNKLERLSLGTFTEPDTLRATFSGFPGRTSDNPFQRAKTTSTTQSPLLQEFIDLENRESSDVSSISDVHSEATMERDVPNITRKKTNPATETIGTKDNSDGHLRQTSELGAVSTGVISRQKTTVRPTDPPREKVDETKQSQIISKLRTRLPLSQSSAPESDESIQLGESTEQQDSESAHDDTANQSIDGTTGILRADAIPEEYRNWPDFPLESDPSLEAGSTLDIATRKTLTLDEDTATQLNEASAPNAEPTLAKLFKRAQKRRSTLPGDLAATKPPQPKPEKTAHSVPAISVEITEDEVASILDNSTELSQSKILIGETKPSPVHAIDLPTTLSPKVTPPKVTPPKVTPPKVTPPKIAAPKAQSIQPPPIQSPTKSGSKTIQLYSLKDKLSVTENSGIHDGLFDDVPRADEKPPHPITHDSIAMRPDRSGKTTSQSMLARLRQRREGMDMDVGMASEIHGSGFIRLPTAEIQQVLGRGSYRLLIENIVYEPVDKDGLIQLIKGGVLLGAEQIAEADGDWMPVSQHPVFDELRRRFAAEAHALLSRITNPRDADPITDSSASPDVLVTNPVLINENQQFDTSTPLESPAAAISEPNITPPPSDPLLASAEEPNFAMLSDSEAEDESNAMPDAQPEATASEPVDFTQENTTDSIFKPVSNPIDETHEIHAHNPAVHNANDYQTDADLDDFENETPRKSKKGLLVLLLILVVAGVAAYVLTQSKPTTEPQTQEPAPAQPQATAPAVDPENIDPEKLADDKIIEANNAEQVQEKPEEPVRSGMNTGVFATWKSGAKDQTQSLSTARELLKQKDYRHARTIAAYGMANFDDSADFKQIFEQSIESDKDLHNIEPLEPVALFNINAIRVEDAGKSRQIILTRDGADRFIFKPASLEQRDNWRAEIAAYRLCEMILCNFDIPHTAPAKISREDWERIAPESDLTEKLYWESVTNDGQETQFVQGALQELVPQTTPWPIEITGLWRDWLGTAPTFNALEEDFVVAHERLKNFADGAMYQSILEQQNNITTRQLAEQVSTLILFDFLTNNWERFSGNSALYGLGTPFANGQIISYNNSQSFQSRASRRVLGRFEWTGRFSRSTVAAVRALSPELANSILFEQPSAIERARLDTFWNQHRQALSRIDASVERHGTELVFPFD